MTVRTNAPRDGWTAFRTDVAHDGSVAKMTELIDIIDAIEVPIIVVGLDFRIAGFNEAAADMLGLSPSDIGRAPSDVRILTGLPRLGQLCGQVVASGAETRADLRDGFKWFVVRVAPYTRIDGDVGGTVLTFTNVTAFRSSVDHAIHERESTKSILNSVADPLVVLSADQRIQSGNRAFYTMFGVSRDDTRELPLRELAGGAFDLAPVRGQLRRMFEGADGFQPVEVDHVPTVNDRRTLVLDARPLSLPGDPDRRVLVTFQDITARKRAEEARDQRSEEELRRSEAFLAEGQRLSLTGTLSWNIATGEITWSEELYRMYEIEAGTPVTLELIRTRVHPEDASLLEKMMEHARQGVVDFEWQYRLMMPDRSIKYLHAVAHVSRGRPGEPEYIAAIQDITAGRLSEDALAKARSELARVARASSLGVLTASIAHEVNQPLSGIITNAGTCLRMLDADPPNLEGARETARRTIRDGNRASDVIARLRALFSTEELALEPMDLNEVTGQVLALSLGDLQRNRVTVQSLLAEDLPKIHGDRIQLQQVILNLLRNASDAMADVHDRPRRLMIRTERDDGERVRLSVRDAGVGVDPESMDKLLDAFYTTKTDGMGIGLSVSRSIIERHRGRLWAEANEGPGATFSFWVPIDPQSAGYPMPG